MNQTFPAAEFPRAFVLYVCASLYLANENGREQVYHFGDGLNLILLPDDWRWVRITAQDAHSSQWSHSWPPPQWQRETLAVRRIDYFIYGLSGNYAVRNGFTHSFGQHDAYLYREQPGQAIMGTHHQQLYDLYPVEEVLDQANRNTGLKVMQFLDYD